MTTGDKEAAPKQPDEIAALIASATPGVDAAMRQLESVEGTYYGATFATRLPEATVTSATMPHSRESEA